MRHILLSLLLAAGAACGNGQNASLTGGDGWVELDVTGPGTLTFEGGATLVITGGATDRAVRVRLYEP